MKKPDEVIFVMSLIQKAQQVELQKRMKTLSLKVSSEFGICGVAQGQAPDLLREWWFKKILSRVPIILDFNCISDLIQEKTVLVTGAGGSIGSEIVRQMLPFSPKKILLLGHGENSIYQVMEQILQQDPKIQLVPIIADVADQRAMKLVFSKYGPDLVFHAGAHKHVPLMEDNGYEAIRVNSYGTWVLGDLAGQFGTSHFILISSDKAVNPVSIMGASKRLAELAILELQKKYGSTQYMAVRFGNVIGSRGSVIPKFEAQIAHGGPVTVTDPKMCRYFMFLSEAAGLVLQTAAIGKGGHLYVLDMGKPIKIVELAKAMIHLYGFEPEKDIAIEFCGCRKGEKLSEELFYDSSHVDFTVHPQIFSVRLCDTDGASCETVPLIERIEQLLVSDDIPGGLRELIPEYRAYES